MENIYIKDIKMHRYMELLDLLDNYKNELQKVDDERLKEYYLDKIEYYNIKIRNLKNKIGINEETIKKVA